MWYDREIQMYVIKDFLAAVLLLLYNYCCKISYNTVDGMLPEYWKVFVGHKRMT